MGRGPHKNHIEPKVQVSVKFRVSRLYVLQQKILTSEYTANKYVNELVEKDLKQRGIIK